MNKLSNKYLTSIGQWPEIRKDLAYVFNYDDPIQFIQCVLRTSIHMVNDLDDIILKDE